MRNSLCFTTVMGKIRHVEFARIEYIRPVYIVGICGGYYNINVTDVVYTDTGETDKDAQFGLFTPDDRVTYRGKAYGFEDLDRLCMVVENENNLTVLESL